MPTSAQRHRKEGTEGLRERKRQDTKSGGQSIQTQGGRQRGVDTRFRSGQMKSK